MTYDLKITNGTIVDGTGKPRYQGDIAIQDGKIAAIGQVDGEARKTIDAKGAIVWLLETLGSIRCLQISFVPKRPLWQPCY